jgi:hypothetical protein
MPNSNVFDLSLVSDGTVLRNTPLYMLYSILHTASLHRGEDSDSWDFLPVRHGMCHILDFVRDLDLISGPR